MNVTQVIRGQEATLTLSVYSDGDLSDQGTPTFTLTDLDGTVTDTLAVADNSDGTYTVTIPAKADLAFLQATLTFGASLAFDQGWVEVVGSVLFTEYQARRANANQLASTTVYPDADIAAARIRITDWLETQTGRSWVPRYGRLVLPGSGANRMSLWTRRSFKGASSGEGASRDIIRVLSASVGGTAVSTASLELDGSHLWLTSGSWASPSYGPNVTVDVEYGLESLRNGVDQIALMELLDTLPSDRMNQGAVSATDEFGSYSWQPQNNGRPSRIPAVNAWCRDQDVRVGMASA